MDFGRELPDSDLEKVKALEKLLIASSTGQQVLSAEYEELRTALMAKTNLKDHLPDFVKKSRTLDVFWAHMKEVAYGSGSWAERRKHISVAFTPLIDRLENTNRSPSDQIVDGNLKTFDEAAVHTIWVKALQRRESDPEGAITVARTLLETVCKRILDETGGGYTSGEDLPKLYGLTAKRLNLAPDQHSQDAIKAILSGATAVVHGLATLRNKLSDSHGRGGKPVRPSKRHAHLAVNIAGALATFLVETHLNKVN
jgi:Abortive infection C-terminus